MARWGSGFRLAEGMQNAPVYHTKPPHIPCMLLALRASFLADFPLPLPLEGTANEDTEPADRHLRIRGVGVESEGRG